MKSSVLWALLLETLFNGEGKLQYRCSSCTFAAEFTAVTEKPLHHSKHRGTEPMLRYKVSATGIYPGSAKSCENNYRLESRFYCYIFTHAPFP